MENLVICVDRDDDVGRKTKASGPIIGIDANIKVATELALIDPEDSDSNAIFAAVKIARENGTEVVTLTGDRSVGITSDTKIAAQLDQVLMSFKPSGVILVIDGAEDEQVIPVIESRVKINSVKTVIVRQSQELEKAYFKVTHFLKEIEEDPNLARLMFGIPGVILMFLALGGAFGETVLALNLLLAVIGIYLLIKGFGYEEELFTRVGQFIKSLSTEKISTFVYLMAVVVFIFAFLLGYDEVEKRGGVLDVEILARFIITSADLMLVSVFIAIVGKIMDDYSAGKYLNVRTDLIFLAFAFLAKLTIHAAAVYVLEESWVDFFIPVLFGIVIFLAVVKITEYFFIEEIEAKKNLISEFANKEVYNEKEELMGKVSRVLLDGSKLTGLKVNRKIIPREDIMSGGEKITVKSQ